MEKCLTSMELKLHILLMVRRFPLANMQCLLPPPIMPPRLIVYADWNDLEPMQKVMPAGPNYTRLSSIVNDYSTWIFAYTQRYHLIGEGENELTAKLSCDLGPFNLTKFDSVNISGIS
jgi:hypothetical protein